jgi:threonylcarbamoyladenosine tRNA methylthiotransferase MtaB
VAQNKIAFHSLGCKVNQNEAEAMLKIFEDEGYQKVDFSQKADIYLIHTCTVTHLGDRKSRQMVRRAIKQNPEAIVIVSGCYAQVSPDEVLDIPGVDLVIGTQERGQIFKLVEQVKESRRPINAVRDVLRTREFEELAIEQTGRVRAFLKIQEGCQQFCTYCIIPFARGPVRSRDPEKTLLEIQRLVRNGYKEVVLTGIHTGAYGQDLAPGIDLNWLVEKIAQVPGLARLRISSLDPNEFTSDFINTIAKYPATCPHFHISLQSGDDDILKKMGRCYTTDDFRRLLKQLREKIPQVAITTDIMVGFPGETSLEHQNSLDFVEEMEFSGLHVFKYSPRAGTKAASFKNQLPPAIKEERSKEMIALGKNLEKKFASKFLGQTLNVLAEQKNKEGLWEGHTPNYLKVCFAVNEDVRGQIVPVTLLKYTEKYILGEVK